jgi:hypothetical protein
MGRFMIPVCCCCGTASKQWHDKEWEDNGGLQDFCPSCVERFGGFSNFEETFIFERK